MNRRPLVSAGLLLGLGLGGFLDGIVLHQLLQSHHMLTGKRPATSLAEVEVNMFWDGVFHLATWLMTALGLGLLWRAGRRKDVPWSARTFAGSLVLGWGTFNLVEGLVNHHILHLHHVVERLGVSAWDYAFLASGGIMIVIGWGLIGAGGERPLESTPAQAV